MFHVSSIVSIDLSSLVRAISSLEIALERSRLEQNDDLIRDGVIQRFEYTYELAFKLLKRTLEKISVSSHEIDTYSFHQLIRDAAERGLIEDVQRWIIHRYHRNLTSHTYNQEKASIVFQGALLFLTDVKNLQLKLEAYSHD